MACRRCGKQDDFVDGNESEELCKACLDHCCEQCFKQLETKDDYERHMCYFCFAEEFFTYDYGDYSPTPTGPQYFTFTDEEVAVFELSHPPTHPHTVYKQPQIFTFSDEEIADFELKHPEFFKTQLERINEYVKQKGIEAEQKRQKMLNENRPSFMESIKFKRYEWTKRSKINKLVLDLKN